MMVRVCSVEGCENIKIFGNGMCQKHYQQVSRNGKVLTRTILDKNEYCYIPCMKCYEFLLYNKDCIPIGTCIIDEDDFEKISNLKWYLNVNGYAATFKENKNIYLHKLITKDMFDGLCDHINGDKLDNRKENLREATHSQNMVNKKVHTNNASGRTGVFKMKGRKEDRWWAYICVDKKSINLGYYGSFEEACKVREDAEIKYFGEFQSYVYKNEGGK